MQYGGILLFSTQQMLTMMNTDHSQLTHYGNDFALMSIRRYSLAVRRKNFMVPLNNLCEHHLITTYKQLKRDCNVTNKFISRCICGD